MNRRYALACTGCANAGFQLCWRAGLRLRGRWRALQCAWNPLLLPHPRAPTAAHGGSPKLFLISENVTGPSRLAGWSCARIQLRLNAHKSCSRLLQVLLRPSGQIGSAADDSNQHSLKHCCGSRDNYGSGNIQLESKSRTHRLYCYYFCCRGNLNNLNRSWPRKRLLILRFSVGPAAPRIVVNATYTQRL